MMQKLFYGFCTKVKHLNTYQQLQAIMVPPTPENFQRLTLSVQQLIQSQPANWKLVHRLHQIKDQFQVQINMEQLIEKLKHQSIDSTMQKFAIELAQSYFTVDENFFADIYYQLLRMEDLLFVNQIKLLQIYFQFPEYLDQDQVIPRLVQDLLAHDELEQYELEKTIKIFGLNLNHLSEENEQWMITLKEELCEQFCKTLPTFDLKQFRELVNQIRTSEFQDENIKQTIFQYYKDNRAIFTTSLLQEMMNLCNVKFYSDEQIKYDLLVQLNFKKIRNMNESKFVNINQIPYVPQREQEIMANLITLSGIQLDRQFLETYSFDAFAKRREQINKLQEKDSYIKQIVREILSFIDGQFNYLIIVVRLVDQLQLTMPELLNEISKELQKILDKQIINPPDLLYVLYVLDSSNIYFEIKNCVGIDFLNKFLQNAPYSLGKINYLQRLYALNKDQQAKILLEKSYTQDWPLENIARQSLLKHYYKETISRDFVDFFNDAIDQYTKTKRLKFQKLAFYKMIVRADWQKRLLPEHTEYFQQGKEIANQFKKSSSKTLETSSFFEQEIKNDIMLYLPKNFKLLTNQYVDGTEIDIVIENEKGKKLYMQLHGVFHFYADTTKLNYLTTLENYYLSRMSNFVTLNYFSRDNSWKNDTKTAVTKLLSCLMN